MKTNVRKHLRRTRRKIAVVRRHLRRRNYGSVGIPKEKRKVGVIYTNYDEKGMPLTYSVLYQSRSGDITELERNSRTPLNAFLKKHLFDEEAYKKQLEEDERIRKKASQLLKELNEKNES